MEDGVEYGLKGGEEAGSGQGKDPEEEKLSIIIEKLNELFITEGLTDQDMLNYIFTVCGKVKENQTVMMQIANNTDE